MTHLRSDPQYPPDAVSGADHVDVVKRGESGCAEKVDVLQIQNELRRPGDLPLDIGRQNAGVGCVDFALHRDDDGR
jgi:hypothetical protein